MRAHALGLLILAACVTAAGAAETGGAPQAASAESPKPKSSLMKWFKNMKKGLERSAVEGRYRKVSTTAVAAVRGGLQEEAAPEKPQFKGGLSDKAAVRQMKEREELKAAVEKIIAGEYDEGERLLNEFEKAHPKSKEIKSVSEAREKLAELRKETQPQPAPEMKPEAPAGQ